MRELLQTVAADPGIGRRAAGVSLVVGTVLNLINQGENLLAGGAVSWPHAMLNCVVPLCVSGDSAVSRPR